MTQHYLNLTRGLLCQHHALGAKLLRLQSTWCEQKRWADILITTPPDFLMDLAQGQDILVHDVSEKPRITRACWQGLEWIRSVCAAEWGLPRPAITGRGGRSLELYFAHEYAHLPARERQMVRYFRQFCHEPNLNIRVCDGQTMTTCR